MAAFALDQDLTEAFVRIHSGDIDGGRAILAHVIARPTCSLDALCFASREFATYPADAQRAAGAINVMSSRFPHSSAARAALLTGMPSSWSSNDMVGRFLANTGKEPAQGPHEAALRLYAIVAACDHMIFMISADDYETRRHPTKCVLVRGGANCLHSRGADSALQLFRDGVNDVDTQLRVNARDLGSHYRRESHEVARTALASACVAGMALSQRELGMFPEARASLQDLGRRVPEYSWALAPLLAEAEHLAGQRPYPSRWRTPFSNEADAVQKEAHRQFSRESGAPTSNSGCALVMGVVLASGAAAWRMLAG